MLNLASMNLQLQSIQLDESRHDSLQEDVNQDAYALENEMMN